jgi:hypothetical protein
MKSMPPVKRNRKPDNAAYCTDFRTVSAASPLQATLATQSNGAPTSSQSVACALAIRNFLSRTTIEMASE